jgi:hypothetical protein
MARVKNSEKIKNLRHIFELINLGIFEDFKHQPYQTYGHSRLHSIRHIMVVPGQSDVRHQEHSQHEIITSISDQHMDIFYIVRSDPNLLE